MGSTSRPIAETGLGVLSVRPRRLPDLVLLIGLIAMAALTIAMISGLPVDIPWVISYGVMLALAAVVRRRRPRNPLAGWFAILAGLAPLAELMNTVLHTAADGEAGIWSLVWVNLTLQVASVVMAIVATYVIGLFPDGTVQRRYERRVLKSLWWLLLLPGLLLLWTTHVSLPYYIEMAQVENPLRGPGPSVGTTSAQTLLGLANMTIAIGVVMLLLRYRRMSTAQRMQTRWLLAPVLVAAFAIPANLLLGWPDWFASGVFVGVGISFALGLAMGLLGPTRIDVDVVLRRGALYAALWLVIAGAYLAFSATLGLAIGQRLPLGWTVTLTVLAMMALQPVRSRLEQSADRWIFGARPDSTETITRLGATLAETYDLESLLPNMAAALEDGLGLEWARVRLEPSASSAVPAPALTVPIMLGDQTLGVVECGPKSDGTLTDEDEAVVATFAQQAALAVRNVRLTTRLAQQATELEASRARLVRAGESERRRMERNIHDGVQQDLVALIGQAGHVQVQLESDPSSAAVEMESLQAGLHRVLSDLRELASGIHPSLLRDRGLLAAVEALAARNPVPVLVRADASLRDLRMSEEVEGAGYYTVAESLANSLKHADASEIEVTLARFDGCLAIRVEDDGNGFESGSSTGSGLANLSERLAALGGRLEVTSQSGRGTVVSATIAMTPWDRTG